MKTIIVDDEPMALALLESYVQKTPYLQLEGKISMPSRATRSMPWATS